MQNAFDCIFDEALVIIGVDQDGDGGSGHDAIRSSMSANFSRGTAR
jgi:hypothetical protein